MRYVTMAALAFSLVAMPAAVAQTSASFKLTESTFNGGGLPQDGVVATSTSYRVTIGGIGDSVLAVGAASASYRTDSGFVGGYPPPSEIAGVRFTDRSTLTWTADPSIGSYSVYRDSLSTLPGGFGSCFASPLTLESAIDTEAPGAGTGYFYLVTARNRLAEEGTKGRESNGTERPNPAPCP